LEISKSEITKQRKVDKSIVTNADIAADQIICAQLKEHFPDDGILSEERGFSRPSNNGRVWVVDPLDGTKAFAKGGSGYCVMIGLVERNAPRLGVVFDPVGGVIWGGLVGHGCFSWENGEEPRRIDPSPIPAVPRLITTPSLSSDFKDRMLQELKMEAAPAMHSVGLKVAEIIRGASHVYFSHHPLSLWDTAAPVAMALAQGSTCTLIDGSQLDYSAMERGPWSHPSPLVISRGVDHERTIQTLARLLKTS